MASIQETVGFHLTLVSRARRNLIAAEIEQFGLYVGQDLIMVQLWNEEGLTQSHLAERVGIEVSTMTKALQRLERYGLVRRCHDTEDTRVIRVFLTEQGRALKPVVTEQWLQAEQRTFAGFTSDEYALLGSFLERIEKNLIMS
jgi:DNA-binding MarR family transcriptional regulator